MVMFLPMGDHCDSASRVSVSCITVSARPAMTLAGEIGGSADPGSVGVEARC
jgi:hypothetical protein